jgi:hypothetical protein
MNDPAWKGTVEKLNGYNRAIFDRIHARVLRGEGVLLSWTSAYQSARYGGVELSALKSFVMSPWTDAEAVETVVRQVLEVRQGIAWPPAD